jgi:hypothetical protein
VRRSNAKLGRSIFHLSKQWNTCRLKLFPMNRNGVTKSFVLAHNNSSVVKVIMWCWIILAATFASEVVLQRNIIGNLLNTLNSATLYSPILPSEYTRFAAAGSGHGYLPNSYRRLGGHTIRIAVPSENSISAFAHLRADQSTVMSLDMLTHTRRFT